MTVLNNSIGAHSDPKHTRDYRRTFNNKLLKRCTIIQHARKRSHLESVFTFNIVRLQQSAHSTHLHAFYISNTQTNHTITQCAKHLKNKRKKKKKTC